MGTPVLQKSYDNLIVSIDAARRFLQDEEVCALEAGFSRWSVQDHLEHLLQVDELILGWIRTVVDGSVDSLPPGRPTFRGYVVLTLGFIPRGKGRAPDGTQPRRRGRTDLLQGYDGVRGLAEELHPELPHLSRDTNIRRHPLLGCFTARQWLAFAGIHHRHHHKIIADIQQDQV
jgi:hypothetical protein